MDVRVITLRFDEALGGFPEAPLRQVAGSTEMVEVREHFFVHLGTPYLILVVVTAGRSGGSAPSARVADDPAERLDPDLLPLYRSLRQWRNERGKRDGVPSYLVMRNAQLAEICRRVPRSLAELRAIEGIGEASCRKYGDELLALLPANLLPAPVSPAAAAGSGSSAPATAAPEGGDA